MPKNFFLPNTHFLSIKSLKFLKLGNLLLLDKIFGFSFDKYDSFKISKVNFVLYQWEHQSQEFFQKWLQNREMSFEFGSKLTNSLNLQVFLDNKEPAPQWCSISWNGKLKLWMASISFIAMWCAAQTFWVGSWLSKNAKIISMLYNQYKMSFNINI